MKYWSAHGLMSRCLRYLSFSSSEAYMVADNLSGELNRKIKSMNVYVRKRNISGYFWKTD